jgi:hypothetical protein
LQSGHGLYPTSTANSSMASSNSQGPNPLPAHSQVGSKSGSGLGGTSTPQPQSQLGNLMDVMGMGGGQPFTVGGPKTYSQLMDTHLRGAPMGLGPEQYYAHAGPPLGVLTHHRFLPPRSMADLPYPSHSGGGNPLGPHTNGRQADIGSPHHVSDSLNFAA